MRKRAILGVILAGTFLTGCGEEAYVPTAEEERAFIMAFTQVAVETGGNEWTDENEANVERTLANDETFAPSLVSPALDRCGELREEPADELAQNFRLMDSFEGNRVPTIDLYALSVVHLCLDAYDEFMEVASRM